MQYCETQPKPCQIILRSTGALSVDLQVVTSQGQSSQAPSQQTCRSLHHRDRSHKLPLSRPAGRYITGGELTSSLSADLQVVTSQGQSSQAPSQQTCRSLHHRGRAHKRPLCRPPGRYITGAKLTSSLSADLQVVTSQGQSSQATHFEQKNDHFQFLKENDGPFITEVVVVKAIMGRTRLLT